VEIGSYLFLLGVVLALFEIALSFAAKESSLADLMLCFFGEGNF
jgi:hypothetical protein